MCLVLVSIGLLASPDSVPIYDGVGVPDQPYRLLGTTPAPSAVSVNITRVNGASGEVALRTDEVGAQAFLYIGEGTFASSSAGGSTVTLAPVTPAGTAPMGLLDGNVYRVSASNKPAVDVQKSLCFISLRAVLVTQPSPFMVYRPAPRMPWQRLKVSKAGTDTYSAPFRALGDYAMVRPAGSRVISHGISGARMLVLIGGVLLLIAITVLCLRRRPGADFDPSGGATRSPS